MNMDHNNQDKHPKGILMWDMAGTLIPHDPITGHPQAIPGGCEFLPKLGSSFRQVVTTGDNPRSADHHLTAFELRPFFETIFGDLYCPVGKPYGEILRHLGGIPENSLVIGDRLRADVPADTTNLVTILINQGPEVLNVGRLVSLIDLLQQTADTFPKAFTRLAAEAVPDTGIQGPAQGGTIAQARRQNSGFALTFFLFEHTGLDSARMVIVI